MASTTLRLSFLVVALALLITAAHCFNYDRLRSSHQQRRRMHQPVGSLRPEGRDRAQHHRVHLQSRGTLKRDGRGGYQHIYDPYPFDFRGFYWLRPPPTYRVAEEK